MVVEPQVFATGHYASVNELLSAALNLLAQGQRYDQWAQDLQEKVEVANAEIDSRRSLFAA